MILKKLLCAFFALSAIAFGSMASAAENIGITLMDKRIPSDSRPIYEQGRVLVPLRAVSEALGATVNWDQLTRTAGIRKWTQNISLTIGQQVAVIERFSSYGSSKETVNLDVSVKLIHNRIYVPLRFVSEQYGYKVGWANHTVSIQSPLGEKERAALYVGELAAARKIAINAFFAGGHYEHPPLQTLHRTENYDTEFLFPEGEALRFFTIEGGETATYFEYKDDFLVASWQAHLDPDKADSVDQLLNDKLTDRTGPTPRIDKAFLYYDSGFAGPASWIRTGRVGTDGKFVQTGYKNTLDGEVADYIGTISLTLPNEKRKETVEIP